MGKKSAGRRGVGLVLAVVAALALTACGPGASSGTQEAPTSAAPPSPVKTAVSVYAADPSISFGSGVEVSFTLTADGDGIPGKASVAVAGHTIPATAAADGTGSVTLTPAQLVSGANRVTVSYAGDASTTAASGSATVTVAPATATVAVIVTPNSNGTTGIATTVVSSTGVPAVGSVNFAVDGTAMADVAVTDGAAAMELPTGVTVGDHQVIASFVPSAPTEVAAATGSATLTIVKAKTSATATGHTDVVRYGDKGLINVAVAPIGTAPVDLSGIVTVSDAGTAFVQGMTDAAGTASLEFLNSADPGSKTYTVTYYGNDAAEAALADVAIQTSKTNVDIGISKPKLKSGESGTITVSVVGGPATPTGTATVTFDGAEVASGPLNEKGKISAPVSSVQPGSHEISVSYDGDDRFDGNSATSTLTVKQPIANPYADGAASINANNPCPASASACVDLSNTKAWMQSGGQVTYGPVSITSGRAGYRTPSGTFSVFWLDKDHKSTIYDDAPMPNSVFFNDGIAFHGGSLSVQSHGCIHLSSAASAAFFANLAVGDTVYVFGSAPY